MNNEVNVSNTALGVIAIGVVIGIILSILINKRKTLNERFIEKCRKEGSYTRAEEIKSIRFFESGRDTQRVRTYRYIARYEYNVNGKTYRKTQVVQAHRIGTYERYPTIYYDKNNPTKARFAKGKSPVFGCLTGIVFAIAIMFIAVNLFP